MSLSGFGLTSRLGNGEERGVISRNMLYYGPHPHEELPNVLIGAKVLTLTLPKGLIDTQKH
jgi:hypothetical protein